MDVAWEAWDCSCGATNSSFAMVCEVCGQLPAPLTSKRAGGWSATVASGPFIDERPDAAPPPGPAERPEPFELTEAFQPPPPKRPERRVRPSPFFESLDFDSPPAPPPPVPVRRRLTAGHVVALIALVAALVVVGVAVSRVGNAKPPDPTPVSLPAP